MRILSAPWHGFMDYLIAISFAAIPFSSPLPHPARILCYTLAIVHVIMTALTAFPYGVLKIIPLRWHGGIELGVCLILPFMPRILGFPYTLGGRHPFFAAAVFIYVIWLLSDYRDSSLQKS